MPQTVTGLYVPSGGAPGEGYQATLSIPDPPAGTNLDYTVGASFYEELLFLRAVLTTDGTVGNRSVVIDVQDANGHIVAALPGVAAQAPSIAYSYNYGSNITNAQVDTVDQAISGQVPPMMLMPNWTVELFVKNMAAGDRFTSAFVTVNRIPTGVEQRPPLALVPTPVTL